MTDHDKHPGLEHELDGQAKCAYCLQSVPTSEAYQPDSDEYAMSFCSRECFDAWRGQVAEQDGDGEGD